VPIFLVNPLIVTTAFVAAILIVEQSADPQARRLDTAGAVLGMLMLFALTFAFIQSGRSGADSAPGDRRRIRGAIPRGPAGLACMTVQQLGRSVNDQRLARRRCAESHR
jgi:DHA2 family methylenomycin A resistance protein-like MFS transporter